MTDTTLTLEKPDTEKSTHQLRAELRQARLQLRIMERKLASAHMCLQGQHKYSPLRKCITCGIDRTVA